MLRPDWHMHTPRFRRRPAPALGTVAALSFATVLAMGGRAVPAAPVSAASPRQAQGSGEAALPPGGTPVVGADALRIVSGAADGKLEKVAVASDTATGQVPGGEVLRLTTLRKPANAWEVQAGAPTAAPVKKGDVLLARFYVRAVKGQAETGEARTQFIFEKNGPPHNKSAALDIPVPREWKRIHVPFVADADYAAGEALVALRMGYGEQVFDVAGFELLNFGKMVTLRDLPRTRSEYLGMAPDAAWRKEAEARIEKIRKGDLVVEVRDRAGKIVPSATVSVEMTRHAFPFGSAVVADMLLREGPDADKYRAFIKENFNQVVLENDLKWRQYEENPERARKGVAWLREQGITVRGHTLVWPSWRRLPMDLPGLKEDKAALSKRIDDHIRQEVTDMRGKVVDWDVVNEPFANHDLMDILGRDAMVHWFKLARQYDPGAVLYLNDYPPLNGAAKTNEHLNHFYETAEFLKKSGAPIGGIGFQGHFGSGVIPPENVLSGLDRFAKLGLPIAITEFDINTTDEEMQAAYTRDFLTAAFSHPSVSSILMWGFWEGRHWLPDAALITRDWRVKPNGKAWLDLVKGTWWTRAEGRTAADGRFKTRGFYGDYTITVRAGGVTTTVPAKLVKNGKPIVVTLK